MLPVAVAAQAQIALQLIALAVEEQTAAEGQTAAAEEQTAAAAGEQTAAAAGTA